MADPVRKVNCPDCWAKPGEPCKDRSGEKLFLGRSHGSRRKRAARKLGIGQPDTRRSHQWPF